MDKEEGMNERDRHGRTGGEEYEAGLKKREDALSAFLLTAKLRIDVSRSIQRLASSQTALRGKGLVYPFVKKKRKKKKLIHCCAIE